VNKKENEETCLLGTNLLRRNAKYNAKRAEIVNFYNLAKITIILHLSYKTIQHNSITRNGWLFFSAFSIWFFVLSKSGPTALSIVFSFRYLR